jgi:phage terminase large subunit-like protein
MMLLIKQFMRPAATFSLCCLSDMRRQVSHPQRLDQMPHVRPPPEDFFVEGRSGRPRLIFRVMAVGMAKLCSKTECFHCAA